MKNTLGRRWIMSKMEKIRWFSGTLLTAVLTVPLVLAGSRAVTAYAAEQQQELYVVEVENVPDAGDSILPDHEELFAGYVMQEFYGGGISTFRNYGGTDGVLNEKEKIIYTELKAAVSDIAAGRRASTEVAIQADLGITWSSNAVTGEELQAEAEEKFNAAVDVSKTINCLLVDCPYELYWFDKEKGYLHSYDIVRLNGNGPAGIQNIKFTFKVVGAYAEGAQEGKPSYRTDISKTGQTSQAVANAQQIVDENAEKSDYAKLTAYKDAICRLTDYNHAVADPEYKGGYGDPWQMIYVFDKDPDTKVVCEGYAKAFQYLCDRSVFHGEVTCYTVSGDMDGGTGAGAHMWNIVAVGGRNYLVDVTNSDSDAIGHKGELFLAGAKGSVGEGYRFQIDGQTVSFVYDPDETISLYGASILTLEEDSYVKALKPVITKQPEPQTVTYGEAIKAVQVSAQSVSDLSYQWYLNDEAIEGANQPSYQPPQINDDKTPGLDAGTYRYQCIVSCEGETTASGEAVLKVEPRMISPVMQVEYVNKVYDGTDEVLDEQGYEIGGDVRKYIGDEIIIRYTICYNSSAVKEADRIMVGFTLEGKDAGNYCVEQPSQEIPANIIPKELTAEISVYDKEYDGTTVARIANAELRGVYSIGNIVIDDVTLNPGTAAFASQEVGNGIPVRFEGFTLSGADAPNYILRLPEDVTASITEVKKPSDENQGENSSDGSGNGKLPVDDKKDELPDQQPEPETEAPKKAALASVKAVSGKKLKIQWKKISGASGYEVQCCLKKNFKSGVKKAAAKKGNKTSLVIKKLKKGKTYYVRVRAYKTVKVNGKTQKLYGAWSKVKKSKKIK